MPIESIAAEAHRQIRYVPQPEDMIAARRRISLAYWTRPAAIAFLLSPVAFYFLGLAFFHIEAVSAERWYLLYVSVGSMAVAGWVLGVLIPLAWSLWGVPWVVRRAFRKPRLSLSEVVVTWDAATIYFSSDRDATRFAFSDYLRWMEDRNVILLFQSAIQYQFLPKRVLDAGQVEDLRSLAGQAGLKGAASGR